MHFVPMSSHECEDKGGKRKDCEVFYMPFSLRLPHPYRGLRSTSVDSYGMDSDRDSAPRNIIMVFCLYRCLVVSLTALVLGSVLGTGLGCRRWKTAVAYEIAANQHVGPD